jgi:hypothetical protein
LSGQECFTGHSNIVADPPPFAAIAQKYAGGAACDRLACIDAAEPVGVPGRMHRLESRDRLALAWRLASQAKALRSPTRSRLARRFRYRGICVEGVLFNAGARMTHVVNAPSMVRSTALPPRSSGSGSRAYGPNRWVAGVSWLCSRLLAGPLGDHDAFGQTSGRRIFQAE